MTAAEERFMVLVTVGGATFAAAADAEREEAWAIAKARRDLGSRVWIMRIDGDRHECVVSDDDPL